MGKKQHQKDKLYLTCTEWKNDFGGFKGKQNTGENARFRRLPYHSCSLSLQPFEHPLCTKDGVIFDLMNIVPFLKKYGINPTNGEKMSMKDLIRLKFHKNADGKYHCPVTFKIFNENTHIVSIRQTGNVYSFEAVEQLNLKPCHLKDLLTDESFTRKDIITLQDPTNLDKFNMSNFYHLKHSLKVPNDDEIAARKDPKYNLKFINSETRDVLAELEREYKPTEEKKEEEKKRPDKLNAAHYSTGAVAAAFTSTMIVPKTEHEAAIVDEDIIRYERVKKKGYVRIVTNYGPLNIELHCEMVPKTCENFLKLCEVGYYKGTIFHRSIRNFMIQGGDPDGTGKGGESAWGGTFKDEFKPNLTHTGRGVLSMANSGPNTNKSQFFFTFRSCRHLDGKHAVFGKIVGGLDTVEKMEKIETDKNDKPKEDILIEDCVVFVNPYHEVDEQLKKEREAERKAQDEEAAKKQKLKEKETVVTPMVFKQGIGKYINPSAMKRLVQDNETPAEILKKKTRGTFGFKDFSSW